MGRKFWCALLLKMSVVMPLDVANSAESLFAPAAPGVVVPAFDDPLTAASSDSSLLDYLEVETLWRVTAGAMLLQRNTPESQVLMEDTSDPTRNLNANDFQFDRREPAGRFR